VVVERALLGRGPTSKETTMRFTTFFFTCSLMAGTVHCGGSDGSVPAATTSPTAPSASPGDDAGVTGGDGGIVAPAIPDAGAPSGTCDAMPNDSAPITTVDMVATAAPAATGGAVQDGTYHLTALTLYVGPTGKSGAIPITLKGVMRIQTGVVDSALDGTNSEGDPIAERTRETFTTAGASVSYTMTCPTVKTRTGTYSTSGSSLTLFLVNDIGQTVGYTYSR
jgi:hypothetical protein